MIRENGWEPFERGIIGSLVGLESRSTTGARRGREIFQQKNTCDQVPQGGTSSNLFRKSRAANPRGTGGEKKCERNKKRGNMGQNMRSPTIYDTLHPSSMPRIQRTDVGNLLYHDVLNRANA